MNNIPWIPSLALEYLDFIIRPDWRVFEYGSGGSTLYFSQKANSLVSIEHDKEWYSKVLPHLPENVIYKHIPPEEKAVGEHKANPHHYTSNPLMANFKPYVSEIDKHVFFDLIFIDGRSRAACLMHAAKKVLSGGWIILDNFERDYYWEQTNQFFGEDAWESILFFGHGPYIDWPWKTLFLRKL